MTIRAAIFTLLPAATACTPQLGENILRSHAERIRAARAEVIEASARAKPAWIRFTAKRAGDRTLFTGEGTGPTLDAAKSDATRDLYAAIASYVSADVKSSFSAAETSAGTEEIRDALHTQGAARLHGVAADALYWEHVESLPRAPGSSSFRYYLRAGVPEEEIARARDRRLADRARSLGRKTIAVLPFQAAGDSAFLGRGLAEELSRRLAAGGTLRIATPNDDQAGVEQARDTLLADFILRGTYQKSGGWLRVSWVLYDGSGRRIRALKSASAVRDYRALGELTDEIAAELSQATGSQVRHTIPAFQQDAFEAYHDAYQLYRDGFTERALLRIQDAIAAAPDDPRPYLRMGRILERLGRYARLPAIAKPPPEPLRACTELGRRAASPAPETGAPPSWYAERTRELDPLLEEVASWPYGQVDAGAPPISPFVPTAAAEAYWLAWHLAREQGDRTLEAETALALADLGTRTDRLAIALVIDDDLALHAEDPHHRSLALAGKAQIHKKRGALDEARAALEEALAARRLLGEKPYLLEVLNELAGVEVEAGQLARASLFYEEAWHIAGELENRELSAVLANNLGVIAYARGDAIAAETRFSEASAELTSIGEAQGRVSSALNLALILSRSGDAARAEGLLTSAEELVRDTAEEGRAAEVKAARALLALDRGRAEEAIAGFAESWTVFQGLSRGLDARRAQNAVLAAEFQASAGEDRAVLDCIAEAYWSLDAGLEAGLIFAIPANELVFALNGAAAGAISGFDPPYQRLLNYSPPPLLWNPTPAKYEQLDDAQRMRRADEWIAYTRRMLDRSAELIAFGRQLRDIIRLNCNTEKQTQLKALLAVMEGARLELARAIARAAREEARHAFTKLEVARDKVTVLGQEMEQCIGEQLYVLDSTEVVLIGESTGGGRAREAPPPSKSVERRAVYERILGAFRVDPEAMILLDPQITLAQGSAYGRARKLAAAEETLRALVSRFHAIGAARQEAAAAIDLAAVEWLEDRADDAYREVMNALSLFARGGDLDGLAHAYEWLGYFFRASGAIELAADHSGAAYALYIAAGDERGAARIIPAGAYRRR